MEWKTIPGYPAYRINRLGEVQSCWSSARPAFMTDSWKTLTPVTSDKRYEKTKYLKVSLTRSDKSRRTINIHTLVMLVFVGPRAQGKEVRHKDGNKSNNTLDNLEYATSVENNRDRIKHGTMPLGEKHGNSKLTDDKVRQVRDLRKSGLSFDKIGALFGVSKKTVLNIIHGRIWRHVS